MPINSIKASTLLFYLHLFTFTNLAAAQILNITTWDQNIVDTIKNGHVTKGHINVRSADLCEYYIYESDNIKPTSWIIFNYISYAYTKEYNYKYNDLDSDTQLRIYIVCKNYTLIQINNDKDVDLSVELELMIALLSIFVGCPLFVSILYFCDELHIRYLERKNRAANDAEGARNIVNSAEINNTDSPNHVNQIADGEEGTTA